MSEKIIILIVEDDYGWTKIITNSLNNEEDFIVVGAVNNKELIRLLYSNQILF